MQPYLKKSKKSKKMIEKLIQKMIQKLIEIYFDNYIEKSKYYRAAAAGALHFIQC